MQRPPRYQDVCKDCGEEFPTIFMLHDSVWRSLCDTRKDRLCFACTDKRSRAKLGRDLTIEDFPKVRCNEFIFLGYMLGGGVC